VIENEFGEVAWTNEILLSEAGEQIVEMNNGCVCCTVRGDLIRILGELKEKRDSGKARFRALIIETTEWPIRGRLRRVLYRREIGKLLSIGQRHTMVDAKHASKQLDDSARLRNR